MIDNLISNGIKYNKEDGKITLILDNEVLKIIDTGIGIDTKIFSYLINTTKKIECLSSGIGLGLNIVKGFCDSHKIDLKIDSKKI